MKNIQKIKDCPNSSFDTFKYNKCMGTYPFNDKKAFNSWLKINNLSQSEFRNWFDKSSEDNCIEDNLWLGYLLNEYNPEINLSEKFKKNQFGVFIDFFIQKSKEMLIEELLGIENSFIKLLSPNTLVEKFCSELTSSLISIITPTLTLELNVSRVSNKLIGDTSEERFKHYIIMLTEKKYQMQLFGEYPVLLELLSVKTENTLAEYVEFYQRLLKDYSELGQKFGPLGKFITHQGNKGDSHKNGRYVRVCEFENLKIVYKPRNLEADKIFQHLLLDLNEEAKTSFKTCIYIDKGKYGWSEFIEYQACNTKQEYQKYYITLGQYIMLLYILNSCDFHFENIIANGENPILIDLETIIHTDHQNNNIPSIKTIQTVINSYILPQVITVTNQERTFDFSAIGYEEKQKIHSLDNYSSDTRDDMHLENVETRIEADNKTHILRNDFGVTIDEIKDLVTNGFTLLYKFLQNNKKWLGTNSHYKNMLTIEYRCILRPTNIYGAILINLLHPDNLRSQLDRNLFISSKLWVLIKHNKNLIRVFKSEYKNLISGDIPIFGFHPKLKHIICSNGNKLEHYFKYSTQEKIKLTQKNLSTQNFNAQVWIIQASIKLKEQTQLNQYVSLPPSLSQSTTYINDACVKGIEDISLSSHDHYKWMNWTILKDEKLTLVSYKDYELFNGNLGAILYLSYYAAINQKVNILKKVNQSVNKLIDNLFLMDLNKIGGFDGAGGVLYGLSKIYQNTKNQKILLCVDYINDNINKSIKNDDAFDIISGSAGCILALITAFHVFKDNKFIETGRKCANHIIDNFNISNPSEDFNTKTNQTKIRGGFSHGVTGIGYSLVKLSALTGENYQNYINRAFNYEDSLYDSSCNNYLDLRDEEACFEHHSNFTGWCNGSLGIGLARLNIIKNNLLPNRKKQFKLEIPQFIEKIMEYGFDENDSLCHGSASALEYLYQVSMTSPEIFSVDAFNSLCDTVRKRIVTKGIKNGTTFSLFDPSLLVGTIGIAYQFLRFSHPKKVGNILLLT